MVTNLNLENTLANSILSNYSIQVAINNFNSKSSFKRNMQPVKLEKLT
jgi:hypothetical protein